MNVNKKRFLEVLEEAPELRKDRIAELKKAIAEGTYQVKAEYIAEKLIREWLCELAPRFNNLEGRGLISTHRKGSFIGLEDRSISAFNALQLQMTF